MIELDEARRAFGRARAQLRAATIGREGEIDLLLLALVAGQNVMMLGPPGVGKSYLASKFAETIDGAKFFGILLTKTTTPEEVFGPLDLKAYTQGKYERILTGRLAAADIGFLDETWKASSAILNTLLTIMNERSFDNGGKRIRVPLQMAIGASNEEPEDESLIALSDRFLIRALVSPLSDANAAKLWSLTPDPIVPCITPEDIETIRKAREGLPAPFVSRLLDLRSRVSKECKRVIGDRRIQQIGHLYSAAVALHGVLSDAMLQRILLATLWDRIEEIPTIARILGENPIPVPAPPLPTPTVPTPPRNVPSPTRITTYSSAQMITLAQNAGWPFYGRQGIERWVASLHGVEPMDMPREWLADAAVQLERAWKAAVN